MNKIIIFLIFVLLISTACSNQTEEQKDYNKCTAVCSAVVGDDFVDLDLCVQECRKQFLENDK